MLRRTIIGRDSRHRPRVFARRTGARTSAMFALVSTTRLLVGEAFENESFGLVVDGYTT